MTVGCLVDLWYASSLWTVLSFTALAVVFYACAKIQPGRDIFHVVAHACVCVSHVAMLFYYYYYYH
jgi:hypothetical protein